MAGYHFTEKIRHNKQAMMLYCIGACLLWRILQRTDGKLD